MLNEKMTLKEHIGGMSTITRKLIHIIKQLRKSTDMNVLKTVYFTLYLPIISYCIRAWGEAAQTHLITLKKNRIITFDKLIHKKPKAKAYDVFIFYKPC